MDKSVSIKPVTECKQTTFPRATCSFFCKRLSRSTVLTSDALPPISSCRLPLRQASSCRKPSTIGLSLCLMESLSFLPHLVSPPKSCLSCARPWPRRQLNRPRLRPKRFVAGMLRPSTRTERDLRVILAVLSLDTPALPSKQHILSTLFVIERIRTGCSEWSVPHPLAAIIHISRPDPLASCPRKRVGYCVPTKRFHVGEPREHDSSYDLLAFA